MRRGLLVVVAALALVAPAQANAPSTAGLQRQITGLKAQLAAMGAAAKVMQTTQTSDRDRATCLYVLNRDSYVGLFHTLALVVQSITGSDPPADPPKADDQGACQRSGITRNA